jgi:hypothetical protein
MFNSICGLLPWQFPGDDVQSEDDEHTNIHYPGETEKEPKLFTRTSNCHSAADSWQSTKKSEDEVNF